MKALRLLQWIVLLLAGTLTVSSCSKDEFPVDGNSYEVQGRLYQDCNRVPFANQKLQLVNYTNANISCKTKILEATTDNAGRFYFSYSDNECGQNGAAYSFTNEYQISLVNPDGSRKLLISRIPGSSSLDLGGLYANGFRNIYLDLRLKSSFEQMDTLIFGTSATDYVVYGSLGDSLMSQKKEYMLQSGAVIFGNQVNSGLLYYGIGMQGYQNSVESNGAINSVVLQSINCNSKADTVLIELTKP